MLLPASLGDAFFFFHVLYLLMARGVLEYSVLSTMHVMNGVTSACLVVHKSSKS